MILNQSSNIQIDPAKIEEELINLLTQKAGYFMIGDLQHRYDHSEGIFFRNGPNK